jgi:hypothetical protein
MIPIALLAQADPMTEKLPDLRPQLNSIADWGETKPLPGC